MNNYKSLLAVSVLIAILPIIPVNASSDKQDKHAKKLLDQMAATLRGTKSLDAKVELVFTKIQPKSVPIVRLSEGTLKLSKPNLASFMIRDGRYETLVSDGNFRWSMYDEATYIKKRASPDGGNLSSLDCFLLSYFFTQNLDIFDSKKETGHALAVLYIKQTKFQGQIVDIVEVSGEISKDGDRSSLTCYIDRDHLLRRSILHTFHGLIHLDYDARYKNIKVNEPMKTEDFAFAPPAGSQPFKP